MTDGDYSYEGLDRVLHERARLSILTAVSSEAGGRSFSELRSLCGLTDGNLSRHLAVLTDGGLVTIKKGTNGKRPLTWARLTTRGRKEFDAYIAELQRVIQDANIRIAKAPEGGENPGMAPA